MVWDLLPDNPACNSVAFIRSNNLMVAHRPAPKALALEVYNGPQGAEASMPRTDKVESFSGTTSTAADEVLSMTTRRPGTSIASDRYSRSRVISPRPPALPSVPASPLRSMASADQDVPESPHLANHVVKRLEDYFQKEPQPTRAIAEFLASNLGVETSDIHLWFHHRRQQEQTKVQLQNLSFDGHLPAEVKACCKMTLPGDLNTLLEMFQCNRSLLLVDLRSSTDFEKSDIHGAINLRSPLSIMENLTLELIQEIFVDDESRRTFNRWFQSRCVVFYDRAVDFSWECPVADALFERFRENGWMGQSFILKGHYREFSTSFDRYISGTRMTGAAKKYLDSLREGPTLSQTEIKQRHMQYEQWLQAFENQDLPPMIDFDEARKLEREKAVEQHQKELEAEFEARFPALYKKSKAIRPAPFSRAATAPADKRWDKRLVPGDPVKYDKEAMVNEFDAKTQLVGPLSSGLDKMREAAGGFPAGSAPASRPGSCSHRSGGQTYDKLGEQQRYLDEFDEIDVKGEGLKYDPAFQHAGKGIQDSSIEPLPTGGDDILKKGRKLPLWERIRSGGGR